MSEQDQDLDTITSNDETTDDNSYNDDSDDVESLREMLERERQARQQLTARAKKAEAELKTFKTPQAKEVQAQTTNNLTPEDIEAKILKAQNVSEEEIAYLRKLAAFNGVSLLDAQTDDMFIAFKAKREQELKSERAKLGVSSRSGQHKQEKTFNTPGLSDAEHKAKWRELNG